MLQWPAKQSQRGEDQSDGSPPRLQDRFFPQSFSPATWQVSLRTGQEQPLSHVAPLRFRHHSMPFTCRSPHPREPTQAAHMLIKELLTGERVLRDRVTRHLSKTAPLRVLGLNLFDVQGHLHGGPAALIMSRYRHTRADGDLLGTPESACAEGRVIAYRLLATLAGRLNAGIEAKPKQSASLGGGLAGSKAEPWMQA